MGKAVDMNVLADTLTDYGFAYLITVGDDSRIHTSAVSPVLTGSRFSVSHPSNRVQTNAAQRPEISLVWPPAAPAGYSLIVDGHARTDGDTLYVTPSRAVLHRPTAQAGSAVGAGSCASDCIEI
jgi:hypothetical protein